MKFLSNFLQILRILLVIAIPVWVLQYFFHFDYFKIGNQVKSWVDVNLLLQLLPWILLILVVGICIKIVDTQKQKKELEGIDKTSKKIYMQQTQKISEANNKVLEEKKATYVLLQLFFSKFSMTGYSDDEIKQQKENIISDVLAPILSYHGKCVENEDSDAKNIFALLFYSQDEALEFVTFLTQRMPFLNDDLQPFGYGLELKIIMDVRDVKAMPYYVVEFLSKIINSLETGEICTTVDFGKRYNLFGENKNYLFTSKGNYCINKIQVELLNLHIKN